MALCSDNQRVGLPSSVQQFSHKVCYILHIVEDAADAFLGPNDPESCCAVRPFCEDTALVPYLFVIMPHKQFCDVAAAWDDEREIFSCVECHTQGLSFFRGLSFEMSFPTAKQANSLL